MGEGILDSLEVGSNAFELIEFSLDRYITGDGKITVGRYGVNVAKVREVVRMPAINPLASGIPGVAGVFELRGIPIPAINLAVALGDANAPIRPNQQIIVTEFSLKRAGFIVNSTERIRRIAWEKVLPPTADRHTCINGMTLVENNEFLFILDLERILIEIEAKGGGGRSVLHHGIDPEETPARAPAAREKPAPDMSGRTHILLVDDSDIILKNAKIYLEKEGLRVSVASNGLLAKNFLQKMLADGEDADMVDVIVTDVEMPKMDGLTLTRWIKSESALNAIPVILHTSLSGTANLEHGRMVGANAYVVKNDIQMLLGLIRDFEKDKDTLSFPE